MKEYQLTWVSVYSVHESWNDLSFKYMYTMRLYHVLCTQPKSTFNETTFQLFLFWDMQICKAFHKISQFDTIWQNLELCFLTKLPVFTWELQWLKSFYYHEIYRNKYNKIHFFKEFPRIYHHTTQYQILESYAQSSTC